MPVILAVSVCSVPLPSTYFNVTEPSFATAYVSGLMCFSVSFNCFTFTASVSAVPFSTLVIFLLPASIPVLVMDGPPVIVIPALLILVSPIVKEPSLVKSTSLFKEYVNCLPAWSNTMFLPALKVTLSPGLTFSEDDPFVVPPLLEEVTFQPELLIA